MITKTTLSAVRALVYLGLHGQEGSLSPRRIAEQLGESPTYMAKVTRLLVRADLLRAEKGAKGGVRLGRAPSQITLLAIVEACQGSLAGDYCQTECAPGLTCGYHAAAV